MPRGSQGIYHNFTCNQPSHDEFSMTEHQQKTVDFFLSKKSFKGLLLYHRLGCLAPDTPVLLWNGQVKKANEIKIGDELIGDDGTPRTVLELIQGIDAMYKVEQTKGDSYVVNGEHILSLQFPDRKTVVDIRVRDYLKLSQTEKDSLKGYKYDPTLLSDISVTLVGEGAFYGWRLNGNKRFLLGDFTVTHNSGKTCTSIIIADKMLRRGMAKRIYILTPGSLRKGWLMEYCNTCGYKPRYIRDFFTFITYNYDVGKDLTKKGIDFNDSLVIIDEVHNLINGVKNLSKNPTMIYEALKKANCRILALSGTPIFNYVYEWPILGNLLKPGTFPVVIREDSKAEKKVDTQAFMEKFNEKEDGTIVPKNPTRMKRDLEGIISYFPGAGSDFYPDVIYMDPIQTVMTPEQEIRYWEQQEQERKFSKPPSKKLKMKDPAKYKLMEQLYIMATKNILTRSASNFYYPPEYLKKSDVSESSGGWISHDVFKDRKLVDEYSTKVSALILNILLHPNQKHVLFTFFKEKSGVYLIHNMLKMCGIKSLVFSGDLNDSKRQTILKRFNAPTNRHGESIPLLLVTEAGAEGITIFDARHMHILESSPRENKIQQAIGRIVRYKSHFGLPPSERNVRIWRYWSVSAGKPVNISTKVYNPDGEQEKIMKTINPGETIDVALYIKGQANLKRVKSFLELLQEVSVT